MHAPTSAARPARSAGLLVMLALVLAATVGLLVHSVFAVQECDEAYLHAETAVWRASVVKPRAGRPQPSKEVVTPSADVRLLAAQVCDANPDVRRAAAAALAGRGDPSLAVHLAPAVASEDADVRADALGALRRLGGPGARVLLARAAQRPDLSEEQRAWVRDSLAVLRRNVPGSPSTVPGDLHDVPPR